MVYLKINNKFEVKMTNSCEEHIYTVHVFIEKSVGNKRTLLQSKHLTTA